MLNIIAKLRADPRFDGMYSYEQYLQSPHWQELKARFRDRSCQYPLYSGLCNKKRCELHHFTYETLGAERDEDLASLCREHHELHHYRERQAGRKLELGEPLKKIKKRHSLIRKWKHHRRERDNAKLREKRRLASE